jgi:autotransporter-associated beta strand protein
LRLSDINALGNPNNTSAQRPIELAGGTLETRVTAGGPFTTNTTVTGNAAILANIGTAGAGTTDTFGTLSIGSSQLDIGTGANVTSGTMSVNFTSTTLSGNATLNVTNGATAATQVSPGPIGETGGPRSLTKTGTGTLLLAATNTYSGNTTNAGGKILITGTLSNSAVFVTGGTLGGTGTLSSAMLVQSGGTLAPGMSIGTLICNNSVTLQGNTLMEVNRTNSPNADNLVVNGSLTLGGTLTVTNIGSPFADGDTFALFNATSTSGAFALTNLPAIGAGTNWWTTNNFATLTFNVWPNAASSNFVRTAGLGLRFRLMDLVTGAIAGKTIALQSLSPGSQGASITFDGTYVRYIPANDNNDTFTYTINDGRGGTPTGTINVTVVKQSGSAQSISVADGAATIDCAGIPGYPYLLQRSTNLADWVTILTTNAPTNGLFNFTDTFSDLVTPPPSAYYRVAQP